MSKTINSKILIRRDTTANWSTNNPILAAGQIGFDITVGKHKIGDGSTHWNDLSYFALVSDLTSKLTYYSDTSENWARKTTLVSIADVLYIYTDNNGGVIGVKMGDGTSYVVDLPFMTVTPAERNSWNNKVRCYLSSLDSENLIFTNN